MKSIRALIVVSLIILTLGVLFALLGRLVFTLLAIPDSLGLPLAARAAGLGVLAVGFACMGWLFKYRPPREIFVSTLVTFQKALRGAQREASLPRSEPLILQGPQRYVRHPLYFCVVVMLLGWWLLLDITLLLWLALVFFLWFTLVVIRFEERELMEMFEEQYEAYAKAVPMIFPSLKPRWP
ncbi:MAG: isoprenylcysteine carboxylmethyltransferase family protein [Chloroflexi bacterium]|nr:isoprenylcysteine carboxylmethyltransferase family protein [Chloroflexota bacterium]